MPLAPRLADVLDPVEAGAVIDDDEWVAVEVRGAAHRDGGTLELDECRLVGVSLVGSAFDRFRATDVLFEDCDLSGVFADDADLLRVELRGCRLRGLVLPQARLRDVRIVGGSLDEASLRLASGSRVEITGSSLREADLYGIELAESHLTGCDLTGAELSAARLPGARLHGSVLDGVRGAEGLRGVVIDSAQVHPLALRVLAALDIEIDDEIDDGIDIAIDDGIDDDAG
jgi:uncharacterized protein YjbI with pentapeptide repeats